MISLEEKRALLDRLRKRAQLELSVLMNAARNAAEAATHEENKPEHGKDMRSTEASYLARGQAARVDDLSTTVQLLESLVVRCFDPEAAVGLGALVELQAEDGSRRLVLLAPRGGGLEDVLEDRPVRVVTARSPLGAALMGLHVGDDCEVTVAGRLRALEVVAIG